MILLINQAKIIDSVDVKSFILDICAESFTGRNGCFESNAEIFAREHFRKGKHIGSLCSTLLQMSGNREDRTSGKN